MWPFNTMIRDTHSSCYGHGVLTLVDLDFQGDVIISKFEFARDLAAVVTDCAAITQGLGKIWTVAVVVCSCKQTVLKVSQLGDIYRKHHITSRHITSHNRTEQDTQHNTTQRNKSCNITSYHISFSVLGSTHLYKYYARSILKNFISSQYFVEICTKHQAKEAGQPIFIFAGKKVYK